MGYILRKAILLVGAVFLAIALTVLVSGYGRLELLTTCKNTGTCTSGIVSDQADIVPAIDATRLDLIYGVVFSFISGILVLFGVFGSADSKSPVKN